MGTDSHPDMFMDNKILAVTSQSPTGPWSPEVTLYVGEPLQEGGCIYSPAIHDYFDGTGQSLVITFTNHPNVIQAIKVVSTAL